MEPKVSLLCSQVHQWTLFWVCSFHFTSSEHIFLRCISILLYHLCHILPDCLFSLEIFHQHFICISHFLCVHAHACLLAHAVYHIPYSYHPSWLNYPHNITRIQIWSSALCTVLHFPVTSSLCVPDMGSLSLLKVSECEHRWKTTQRLEIEIKGCFKLGPKVLYADGYLKTM